MNFQGYRRPDGTVGVRNHVLIMPVVVCANMIARGIAQNVKGTVWFEHQHGCGQLGEDAEITKRVFIGFGAHPNVGGVLVVGLGCETIRAQEIAEEIKAKCPHKAVHCLIVQDEGGTFTSISKGSMIALDMVRDTSCMVREPVDIASLVLGTECGGSCSYSGITANPALGVVSDRLGAIGGTVILAETTELIGAEHLMAARAVDDKVAQRCYEVINRCEKNVKSMGVDMRGSNPAPGNIASGLSTIEEKSLGCIYKAGSMPLQEVIEYAMPISKKGLIWMDTPGHDIEQMTAMVAGGCHLTIFTTGRGTPTGSPIAPTIKVSSNSRLFQKMPENIDFNAGTILANNSSIKDVGNDLFQEMVAVASGKLTRAELLGCNEFAIKRIGPST